MSSFDQAFADRVREVFEAYDEPVDPASLARMRAALGHVPAHAPDRAPTRTRRRGARVALVAALAAMGVWLALPGAPAPETVANTEPSRPLTGPPAESQAEPGLSASRGAAGFPDATPRPDARPSPLARTGGGRPPAKVGAAEAAAAEVSGAGAPVRPARTEPATRPGADPSSTSPPGLEALSPAPDPLAGTPPSILTPAPSAAPRLSRPDRPAAPARRSSGVRAVVSTSAPLAASAEGIGIAGGLTRDVPVRGRVSVSGGALVAYARYAVEPATPLASPTFLDLGPGRDLRVATRTETETVALEVPLDVVVAVAHGQGVRIGVSAGLTSAVYLSQTFRDQGTRYVGVVGAAGVGITDESFEATERQGLLSRVDLARQLNLGLRLTGSRSPLSADVYARLPLGGLTDRELALTTVGVRLRVPLR